jgi:hypothetical protein
MDAAIERAREVLALARGIPVRAEYVARLDRPGAGYYLVCFGGENATIGVAAVDAASGGMLSHASLPGSESHLAVTAEEASHQAAATGIGFSRLAWCPCQASLSVLLPFWEVSTARGLVYIDQQRRLWTELKPGGPGG